MELKVLRWDKPTVPDEAAIRESLRREGYSVFKWADSGGTQYPPHQHDHHESIWVLEGEIEFQIGNENLRLGPGDRLFLPRSTPHSAAIPTAQTCFYLIGEKD